MDQQRAQEFMRKVVGDMGTALAVALIYIGDRVGLFNKMAGAGPLTAEQFAERSGLHPRYAQEWLGAMVCNGYIEFDADASTYTLPEEHAMFLAASPTEYYLGGLFRGTPPMMAAAPQVAAAFESGQGVSFQQFGAWVPQSLEGMNRNLYEARLVRTWLPAMPEVVQRLQQGGRAIDIGCGTGVVPILIAKAFPQARVEGLDLDAPSIEIARANARDAGVAERVRFQAQSATEWSEQGTLDFVSTFDCIHDMPDPLGVLKRIRRALAPGGTYLMVEPKLSEKLADNVAHPFARLFYGMSCLHCVPQSLAQGGPGLGACWGEGRARVMAHEAGFAQFRALPIRSPSQAFYELKV
jgi:2-polyprenyl-3-methyl-5-hydroxy-6-metoxy-1,4-benzoquinol methylase